MFLLEKSSIGAYCNRLYDLKERQYLGVKLDRSLTFRHHLKAVKDSPLEGDESSIIVVTGRRPGPSSHCSLSKHQFKIK